MNRKHTLGGVVAVLAAAAAITFGVSLPAAADHGGPHCDELPANITPAHPDWDDSLDADHDGIGCEDDSQPPWQAPTTTTTAATSPTSTAPTTEPPAPAPADPATPVVAEPDFTG